MHDKTADGQCLKPKSFFYMHDKTADGYQGVN